MKGVDSIFSEEQSGPNTHGSARMGRGGIFLQFHGLAVIQA